MFKTVRYYFLSNFLKWLTVHETYIDFLPGQMARNLLA